MRTGHFHPWHRETIWAYWSWPSFISVSSALRSVALAIKMLLDVWMSENNLRLMFQQPRCHRESARPTHSLWACLEAMTDVQTVWEKVGSFCTDSDLNLKHNHILKFSENTKNTHLWHCKNMFLSYLQNITLRTLKQWETK